MLRCLNVIQGLSNSERGLSRAAMRQLCISTIFSISDYGSEIWFQDQKTYVRDIQSVQNKAMRRVAGAFRTISIRALEAETELMSTRQRLFDKHRKYATRVLQMTDKHSIQTRLTNDNDENNNEDAQTQLHYVMSTLKENYNSEYDEHIERIKMFTYKPWKETTLRTEISNSTKEEETTIHISRQFNNNTLILYTDGSMLESIVACAYICRNDGVHDSIKLNDKAEVIDGEIVAIREALKYALIKCQEDNRYKKVVVFSDSQACIRKLHKTNAFSSQQNVKTIMKYIQYLHEIHVQCTVEWVPSHNNIEYNERVDKLAKLATQNSQNIENTVYFSHIKRLNRSTTKTDWFNEWNACDK